MKYDGMSAETLARRLDCESLLVLERVTSTQDLLHELADEGAPPHSVVLADEQVRGRGRHNRRWIAGRGQSILCSYLVRPSSAPAAAVTSLRVGLSVLDTLTDMGIDGMLKWPNDVVVLDRKAAGILCEARWHLDELKWIAIGIGINVHGPLSESLADRAITLDEIRPDITRLAVLERLIPRLRALPESDVLSSDELNRLRDRDWLADREIAGPVTGRASGVAEDGALRVETTDGTVVVVGGEIVVA